MAAAHVSTVAVKWCQIAAQFTLTNARDDRSDRLWIARAMSSLPVPVSPEILIVDSVGATLATRVKTARRVEEFPTISSNIEALSTSSRSARFSFWTLSSACFRSWISVAVVYQLSRVDATS